MNRGKKQHYRHYLLTDFFFYSFISFPLMKSQQVSRGGGAAGEEQRELNWTLPGGQSSDWPDGLPAPNLPDLQLASTVRQPELAWGATGRKNKLSKNLKSKSKPAERLKRGGNTQTPENTRSSLSLALSLA